MIEDLDGRVSMIIDGGECEFGLESTIVQLNGDEGTLLRPGAVTYDALCRVCRRVQIAPAVLNALGADEKPLSPGMKYRHYAPQASLTLLDGDAVRVLAFMQSEAVHSDVGFLCYDEEIASFPVGTPLFPLGARADLATQSKRLFAALRLADACPNIKRLYAHLPPKEGLGLALCNRILRAAAHDIRKI